RFFTSIGLALITLSVLLPWLVLKEPLLVTIKASEISDFTWLGQANVWLRQFMSLSLSLLSFCLSPLLFMSGSALLMVSVPTWIIGEILEKKLEGDIRRLEFKNMKNKDVQLAQEKGLALQSKLKSKIEKCFQGICELQETESSDFVERYDFALHFPSGVSPDILVKIIYTKANPNLKLLEKYFKRFISALTKRKQKSIASRAVIIIAHEKSPKKADALFKFLQRADVIMQDLSESEVESITCEKIIGLFFPSDTYPTLPWKQLPE
ncbi:MAG: hypothetical protein Q8L64_01130, partial [bacterium]|nr:hypothetical protein [bacterium]